MTDYKSTLNLPYTDFPMKANLSQREPTILKKWETLNLYQKIRIQNKNGPSFMLHDGPPYANGHIHMGTALNKILKDIVIKSKTFSGFDAPFVPGWDCHGLPIELNVEKKVGKAGEKLGVPQFIKACRDYAANFIEIQREEFKRLGVLGDFENPYLTMSPEYEANIIRSLAKILKNGYLQKGYRPVYWCLDCASALAEAEVEYADKTSSSVDVRFYVVDEEAFLARFKKVKPGHGPLSIPIWTTTPWTLPANQAVALNPSLDYVLLQTETERLLVAHALQEKAMARFSMTEHTLLGKIRGEQLEHLLLKHPFYSRKVPVVLGEHVTVESGTGAVHTAPAHGQDDFVIGKKYDLPLENPVGDNGCYTPQTEHVAGKHVTQANDLIIDLLKKSQTLLHLASVTHSYPHCWRHKTPLIFRATPQWFVNMTHDALRQWAIKEINQVEWLPEWGKSRITSMVENRPDWCISRQRTWGVPIPLFLHQETDALHPDSLALMETVAEKVSREGIEAWFLLDPKELLGEEASQYKKCRDILDVWFDSGVSHQAVLQKREELHFPADLYLEGSDQYRGWFQSSLLTSVAMNGMAPYRTVLTHSYVIDMEGRKMSKSLGNVIAPEKIIQSLGADVLRLWAASVDYRTDIHVSEEILTRTSDTYRRLRNTARFLLSNLNGFDPLAHAVAFNDMLALDRWAISETKRLQEEIMSAYASYQFHQIYQKIHYFCVVELGGFYLDIIKDRQYTTQANSVARRSAQTAMYHMIEALVRWIAPILSFTAEEIWQYIPGPRNESVFLNTWYDALKTLPADEKWDAVYWEQLKAVRNAVNKELEERRAAGELGSGLEARVELYGEPSLKEALDRLGDELRFILITSEAKVLPDHLRATDAVDTEVPGLWVKITAITDPKCERCWHRRGDVGKAASHPTLCTRCVENIEGQGEVRCYA